MIRRSTFSPRMETAATDSRLSVLVLEDDPSLRELLSASIDGQPGLRLAASLDSVSAALAWLDQQGPDVLLTDLGLPDGSGIEVIRYCAQRHPRCDILVITIFGDEKNVLDAVDAGAVGYILKDAGDLDVARFIEDLRNGGSPMSPLVARKLLTRHRQGVAADGPEPAAPRAGEGLFGLTARESETLDLLSRGYTYAEIAGLLKVTLHTIQSHVKNIYSKLAVHSRSEAVFEAQRAGLLAARPGSSGAGGRGGATG